MASRREFSVEQMAQRFGVTQRTIYRDLADLQSRRIPVRRGDHGYNLIEGAVFRPLNLTARERAVLQLALSNPALRRQPTLAKELERLVDKLHAVTDLMEEGREAMLAGPESTGEISPQVSSTLDTATRERQTTEIRYASLTTPGDRLRLIDPYGLFHRQGVWYCAGHCHTNDEMRIFRLDRISEARATTKTFEPRVVDLDAFFADSWSVFQGTERHEVHLHVAAELAPLFRRGNLHEGERVVDREDGSIDYHVVLSHLEEIARFVVGFGGRVKVVGPEELGVRVREIAEGVLGAQHVSRQ